MAASRFTPDNRAAIVERIAAGVSLRDVCRMLELREGTVKGWLTRGRRDAGGPYTDFAAAVDDARRRASERPAPLDVDELRRLVADAARKGSVQAMKLADDMLRRDGDRDDDPFFDF